jgi:hypothetical protein
MLAIFDIDCNINALMKQIAVTIPDNKEQLFIELMKSLSFVENVETIENSDIPEWHKEIIDQRMKNYVNEPESFRDWGIVQKEIRK